MIRTEAANLLNNIFETHLIDELYDTDHLIHAVHDWHAKYGLDVCGHFVGLHLGMFLQPVNCIGNVKQLPSGGDILGNLRQC